MSSSIRVPAFPLVPASQTRDAQTQTALPKTVINASQHDDFVAVLLHEIRTPLHALMGTLELFSTTRLTPQQHRCLATLDRSCSALIAMLDQAQVAALALTGRTEALPASPFSLISLIEEVASTHDAIAQARQLQLYTLLPPDTPARLIGHAPSIRQILNNLVSNAIKFTERGQISLSLDTCACGTEYVYIVIQVKDTGIGISHHDQQHLFNLYYRAPSTRHQAPGCGLGLAISARLAQLMGGTLEVQSVEGIGTTISLRLRLKIAHAPTAPTTSLPDKPIVVQCDIPELQANIRQWLNAWGGTSQCFGTASRSTADNALLLQVEPFTPVRQRRWQGPRVIVGNTVSNDGVSTPNTWTCSAHDHQNLQQTLLQALTGKHTQKETGTLPKNKIHLRILVVDDHPLSRITLSRQLRYLGCTVTLAADAQRALQRWHHNLFDLIITDLHLPDMSGIDFIAQLKKRGLTHPVLGITGQSLKPKASQSPGCIRTWLLKPVNLDELYTCLCDLFPPISTIPAKALPGKTPRITKHRAKTACTPLPHAHRHEINRALSADVQALKQTLLNHDCHAALQQLHRMRGALLTVQMPSLARHCEKCEALLTRYGIGPASIAQVRLLAQALHRI